MPAAAVIRRLRALSGFIGRKAREGSCLLVRELGALHWEFQSTKLKFQIKLKFQKFKVFWIQSFELCLSFGFCHLDFPMQSIGQVWRSISWLNCETASNTGQVEVKRG